MIFSSRFLALTSILFKDNLPSHEELFVDLEYLKLGDNHFWLSLGDSVILLWAQGVAVISGLDVIISEPDVSPLAIQGPLAEDLTAKIFGDIVRDIKFFRYKKFKFLS